MPDLKTLGGIGVAIYIISVIGGYFLPVPHVYSALYNYMYGPVGALAGYGVANFIVQRAAQWRPIALVIVAAVAIIGTVVCASLYWQMYNAERNPNFEARTVHAILFAFSFAFFFFAARWAGFVLSLSKKEDKDKKKDGDHHG
jgi:hypothetical protein